MNYIVTEVCVTILVMAMSMKTRLQNGGVLIA